MNSTIQLVKIGVPGLLEAEWIEPFSLAEEDVTSVIASDSLSLAMSGAME